MITIIILDNIHYNAREEPSETMSTQQQIRDMLAEAPGTFGIYARNLGTDETVDMNADRVMNTESAAKIFILLY